MKILVRVDESSSQLAELRRAYPEATFVPVADEAAVDREIADADAMHGTPSREQFARARQLRWIQTGSAGVEFLHDIPELVASDVAVTNARGAFSATIAEHTFGLLLAFTRALRFCEARRAEHRWERSQGYGLVSGIAGLTMGVVGFGNIGRAIAKRAVAFEMRVLAVDAHPVAGMDGVESVWQLDRLHDMLRETDVLAIAAPITPQTRGMIGATEIGLLRPGGYVIAVSRGGIVDEPALIAALESGHLAGAGLDVTATEPLPPEDPLWRQENVIITPHISGGSKLTSRLSWGYFVDNVGRFIRGEPLNNLVDKKLGY